MKRTQLILPLLAVAGGAAALWHFTTEAPDTTLVAPRITPTSQPRAGDTVSGSGIVEPASELIRVGAQVGGVIAAVNVRVGDQVARGAPLFTIDDRTERAQLTQMRSGLRLAEAQLAQARIDAADKTADYRRYAALDEPLARIPEELSRRRFAAQSMDGALAVRRAQIEQARANIAEAEARLALHRVTAPIGGTILQIRARLGQTALPDGNGDPLVTMGQVNPLHVRIDIDETDAARVNIGAPAQISARGLANVRVTAQFVRAEPLILPKRSLTNSASERVDVRVLQLIYRLPDDAGRFFNGQQVDAFVPAVRLGGK